MHHCHHQVGLLLGGIAGLWLSTAVHAGEAYKVIDLGTLGGPESRAYGINSYGLVVGSSDTTVAGKTHAFVAGDGFMQDLGTLGGASSYAFDINAYRQVIGYSNPSGDSIGRAFTQQNGQMKPLRTLGGTTSQANGINDSGYIVGWSELEGDGSYHAFVLDLTSMRDIGTLGGTRSEALAVSESGLVVGRAYTTDDEGLHAFIYDRAGMHDLGTFGGTESVAYAVNDAGIAVGTAQKTGNTTWRAFVYNGVSKKELGTFGGANSTAYGINASGLVVGEASNSNSDREAFLYDGTKLNNLNDLIEPNSGWTIKDARAINDRGQIAANGCNAELECHALRLDPIRTGVSLSRVWFKRSVVAGCRSLTAYVILSGPAPSGGATVTLSENLAAASNRVSVLTIPEGALSRTFAVKTVAVSDPQSGSIFASYGGLKMGRGLTARPMGVGALTLTPNSVIGGEGTKGLVKLECVAGPGDIQVQLQTSKPAVASPSVDALVIPQGTQTAGFAVKTQQVSARTVPKISATANGISKTKALTVSPPP